MGSTNTVHRSVSALLAAFLIAGTVACSPPENPPLPDPPESFSSSELGPPPRNLDESLRRLERILPPDVQSDMKSGSETDMLEYRESVGRWIIAAWLMGIEPTPLTLWFAAHYGIRDAETISGIISTSFWRRLQGEPPDVEGQLPEARKRGEVMKRSADEHRQPVLEAGRAISASRLGWRFEPADVPTVPLPVRRSDTVSVRVRYMAAFGDGVILTGKQFS